VEYNGGISEQGDKSSFLGKAHSEHETSRYTVSKDYHHNHHHVF
jgi:hypothetical protein